MEESTSMYDEALLSILNKEGQIQPFLNVIFGFLHRRTDFFKPLTPDGKYGFPPNVALNMVRSICLHYANLNNKYSSVQLPQQSVPSSASSPATSTTTSTSSSSNRKTGSETRQQSLEGLINQPNLPNCSTTPSLQSNTGSASINNAETSELSSVSISPETGETRSFVIPTITAHPAEDAGNGAVHDTFSWNQSADDVDVKVYVGRTISKSKQLQIELSRNKVSVSIRDTKQVLLSGTFQHPINSGESMWILVPGEYVQLTLQKEQAGRWWSCLLEGESPIDLTKINAEVPFGDLGDEEQALVRKMTHEQVKKAKGDGGKISLALQPNNLPNTLKEAWNLPGSPFQGQPFDPSLVML
ncbi:hypothetical protein RvY_08679 [Ramazzottius varieornatus]|uniref:CS domain-containing protein n=1 Tax=Ramazzottius varieornatus TaxID=947166 RepID=A0A1D1V6P4_RAMVA|nr:hypothetical protein RvY_08679 [Ramazzottius varieornatus]